MPVYHVHASYIKHGTGSAAGFARYIAREGRDEASQMYRYIERERDGSGKDDLVAQGSANLRPRAPGSAARLWAARDVLDRKNGTVARALALALPGAWRPRGRDHLAVGMRARRMRR